MTTLQELKFKLGAARYRIQTMRENAAKRALIQAPMIRELREIRRRFGLMPLQKLELARRLQTGYDATARIKAAGKEAAYLIRAIADIESGRAPDSEGARLESLNNPYNL
jgi:hypothetical protein